LPASSSGDLHQHGLFLRAAARKFDFTTKNSIKENLNAQAMQLYFVEIFVCPLKQINGENLVTQSGASEANGKSH
jgi:hypothetical protein